MLGKYLFPKISAYSLEFGGIILAANGGREFLLLSSSQSQMDYSATIITSLLSLGAGISLYVLGRTLNNGAIRLKTIKDTNNQISRAEEGELAKEVQTP